MAINQHHLFEDLDGVKCAIVEKNASFARVEFLRPLLEFNGYKVVVVASPPAKGAPAPSADLPAPSSPETFTVGVTDVRFNPTNAVFGRLLKTPDGHIVTLAYWKQQDAVSNDTVPYYQHPAK